jgi:hypothetical protein
MCEETEMTPTIRDLWPEKFGEPTQPTPVAILRQQGLLLGQKTENFVYGEVQSRAYPSGEFAHVLEVVAPLLAFRQPIAVAYHYVDVYPARIGQPDRNNPWNHRDFPTIAGTPRVVDSAEAFMEALKSILQSEETTKLIQTLVAQSTEPGPGGIAAGY